MKKLAELLKDEREKKGLSLQEIAQSLKINVKILKAIEENNVDQLPAKTFLRGFVRSYAQYLRLDLTETMNLFQEEFGPSKPDYMYRTTPPVVADSTTNATESKSESKTEAKVSALPKSESNSKKIGASEDYLTGNKALTILGSLFLVIMIVIIEKLIDKYQKEANTEDLNPPVIEKVVTDGTIVSTEPTPVIEDGLVGTVPTPEGNAGLEAALPLKPSPIPSIAATPSPMPTIIATPTPTPKSTPTPTPTPSPSPSPSATPTPTPSPSPSPVVGTPNEVIIEALNKVTIRYSFDGSKFETLELAADQLHTFKSKKQITLEVNDGGSISLIVNGRDKGVPGTIGKPITLSYPK